MASSTSTIRKASSGAKLIVSVLLTLQANLGFSAEKKSVHSAIGTTRGIIETTPTWSAGVQFGNFGATGLTAQKVGFYQGSLNLGLGVAFSSFALSADYLVHFEENFTKINLADDHGYQTLRGKLSPYAGGGVNIARGLSLRVPFGLQYTMLQDPFNFFGGATLILGQLFADSKFGPQIWFNLGARILL